MDSTSMKCKCPHHKMGAVFLILFGLVFLLKNMNIIDDHMLGFAWPSILILAGITKIGSSKCKCCKDHE